MEDVMSSIDDPNIVLETLVNHSSYMQNKPLEKQPTGNKKSTTSKPVKSCLRGQIQTMKAS
jgi:hypothetical protein